MIITLVIPRSFALADEVDRAVETVNGLQSFFQFRIETASWAELRVKRYAVVDYDAVMAAKKKSLGSAPVLVLTKLPLKYDWLAMYDVGISIVSIGDWETSYQVPPVRVLIAYHIACVCCSLSCGIPETGHEKMYHHGPPIGCIRDIGEAGNDDVFLSMRKGARICPRCARIYARYGCKKPALLATEKILEYVREEAARYDARIPYDVFVSYSSRDREFIDLLVSDLEKRRLKVWRDGYELLPGNTLREKIKIGIHASRCFLIVLSQQSTKSSWVRFELETAISRAEATPERKFVLIPCLKGPCRIPKVVDPLLCANLEQDYAGALTLILKAILKQRPPAKRVGQMTVAVGDVRPQSR